MPAAAVGVAAAGVALAEADGVSDPADGLTVAVGEGEEEEVVASRGPATLTTKIATTTAPNAAANAARPVRLIGRVAAPPMPLPSKVPC